ncbi:MAG: hypothetical protein ABIE47_10465 [Pseudomonadota bacterium]|nr:hypothetical protein [Desulfobacteraceae bacterium]MBL7173068.1 hypothetical protein [Desulfobacteraceae bacterium]
MLDIFSPLKRVKRRGKAKDDFDKPIDVIENFAPKEHQSDREVYYYNYRMMARYKRPLLELLETASQISRFRSDQDAHARQLFLNLKAFYDVNDKLSVKQAAEDASLIRRFRDFFMLFYDRKDFSGDDIRKWLRNMD